MDLEGLKIAEFNLRYAKRWYRDLMFQAANGRYVSARDEQEARDACLYWSRLLRRELDAAVDARRKLAAAA